MRFEAFGLGLLLLATVTAAPFPTPELYEINVASAVPTSSINTTLASRGIASGVEPQFPTDIPSCSVCQPAWPGISSCSASAPVFECSERDHAADDAWYTLTFEQQNWKNILFNPAAFVAAIKCGCADTFQSAYPQCVDCFIQTNQCEDYLGVPSEEGAHSILDGLRNVCGFGSALLGGVAASQASAGLNYTYTGNPPSSTATSIDYSAPQPPSNAAGIDRCISMVLLAMVVGASLVFGL